MRKSTQIKRQIRKLRQETEEELNIIATETLDLQYLLSALRGIDTTYREEGVDKGK